MVLSKMRSFHWIVVLALATSASACTSESDGNSDSGSDTGEVCDVTDEVVFEAADESACGPAMTDYQPLGSAEDSWPSCISDDGAYHLIDTTPSSLARVEAYEQVMDALADLAPSADAFTQARTIYAQEEGLESRLVRREDHNYPPVPEDAWVDGVDDDKQCTADENVAAYPERCAGPARIAPILNAAFAAGQQGEGNAAVHKGRINAALLWFMHLSVYKEANTCIAKAKDCDSSWAYYTGGNDRSGGIGLAGEVRAISDYAHQRIWDGVTAYRCWRDLYSIDDYPTLDDVDEEGQMLLASADMQLADALWYGWARIVRERLTQQANTCGDEAEANWAFIQVAGPVLSEEAARLDSAAANALDALWSLDTMPTADELQSAVTTIDSVFGC